MSLQQAIKILTDHQDWRRGSEEKSMATPTELGIAINVILDYLNETKS